MNHTIDSLTKDIHDAEPFANRVTNDIFALSHELNERNVTPVMLEYFQQEALFANYFPLESKEVIHQAALGMTREYYATRKIMEQYDFSPKREPRVIRVVVMPKHKLN